VFNFVKAKILYRYIFVFLEKGDVSVYIWDIKNYEVVDSFEQDFQLEDESVLSDELISYINQKQFEVPTSYVITLLNSLGQGVIPTCSRLDYKKFSIDQKNVYSICVDNKFTNYVSKIDIKWVQKIFASSGIDYIFSPFILLKTLIDEYSIDQDVKLYILYVNGGMTLLIRQKKDYLFGTYFNLNEEENLLYSEFDDVEGDEDDIFDIEDIDIESSDEEFESDELEYSEDELELIQDDKRFIKYLNIALKEYYTGEVYSSSFIDYIVILSNDEIQNTLVEYIENELLMSVQIEEVNYLDSLLQIAQKEAFS
jgi:hypothetical protein